MSTGLVANLNKRCLDILAGYIFNTHMYIFALRRLRVRPIQKSVLIFARYKIFLVEKSVIGSRGLCYRQQARFFEREISVSDHPAH